MSFGLQGVQSAGVVMVADKERELIIGEISGVFGVRGWVKVFSYTQPRENILLYDPWVIMHSAQAETRKVLGGHVQGKGIVASLEGVVDRDQAHALQGTKIAIRREQLSPAADDEYYWADLIGLSVETLSGESLGIVASLFETGAHDVMVVEGERQRLIPFVQPDIVKHVDIHAGLLVVAWEKDY